MSVCRLRGGVAQRVNWLDGGSLLVCALHFLYRYFFSTVFHRIFFSICCVHIYLYERGIKKGQLSPESSPLTVFRSWDVLAWGLHLSAGEEAAATSDQEAHHSCFPYLISAARAKSPLGSQFSFLLIGALIRWGGKKHIVFAHLKAWHSRSVLPASVGVFLHVKWWEIRREEDRKVKKKIIIASLEEFLRMG